MTSSFFMLRIIDLESHKLFSKSNKTRISKFKHIDEQVLELRELSRNERFSKNFDDVIETNEKKNNVKNYSLSLISIICIVLLKICTKQHTFKKQYSYKRFAYGINMIITIVIKEHVV